MLKSSLILLLTALLGLMSCQSGSENATNATGGEATPEAPAMGIHEATFMGDLEAVQAHIAAGTDLNVKDDYGSTPLQVATTFGKTEVALQLIEAGVDLSITNNDGGTALHTAAFLCRTEIVEALLAAGADQDLRNTYGSTPLESVTAPFAAVKPAYDELSKGLGPFGFKLDYDQLEQTRPIIAEMLQHHAQ